MTRITDPSFRLRDLRGSLPALPASPMLGLELATPHRPDLKLSDYIHRELADPPAAISRPHPGFSWETLGNDEVADGVVAMMLHAIEDFHLNAGADPPAFTTSDAIRLYGAIAGYDPHEPASDRGIDANVAMRYWERPGLPTGTGAIHSIIATVAVDPASLTECRIAIDEFVALQIAVALPLATRGRSEWDVAGEGRTGDNAPGSWGGHGVLYREYDPETFTCVTWGAELPITVAFHRRYAWEAHVVVTEDMVHKRGIGPSGVDWDELIADIKALPPQGYGADLRPGAPLIRLG
jgi:hypothetical protein